MELPPPPPEKGNSASEVLTNGDLLRKILLCLACRSCIVSAALTNKCWLRSVSRLLVPEFCVRHKPRLVGIYVSSDGISSSEFVLLQRPGSEVSAILNHANFGFGVLPEPNVWDSRNGSVLFEFGGETVHPSTLALRCPLMHPNMDNAVLLPPPPQPSFFSECSHAMLLPADHGDDAICYRVSVRTWESNNKVAALVSVLRSGSWTIRCIAMGHLAKSPIQILATTVLIGGKIYMATQAGYILGLNLTTQGFFIVDLPEHMVLDQYLGPGNLIHCRGDDSVLYLFHVDGDKRLNVWLRRMSDDDEHVGAGTGVGTNGWVLRDTISLHETCGHLMEQAWETTTNEDENGTTVMVVSTGDNAEFVFLELGITGVIMYMHLKTKEVKQVYQRDPDDDFIINVHPFMFIRPPVFPILDDHEGEVALHQE